MKRLLAAGAPSIVRIGPVFRAEESGRLHNPEFTMIEWYRLGFDLAQLMDEVAALVDLVLGAGATRRVTYRQLLLEGAGVDPMRSTDAELSDALTRRGVELSANANATRRDLLDLLATHAIETIGVGPGLRHGLSGGPGRARARHDGRRRLRRRAAIRTRHRRHRTCERLRRIARCARARTQNARRRRGASRAGRRIPAPDERLLAAMRHGLPRCAGVALGFDRLSDAEARLRANRRGTAVQLRAVVIGAVSRRMSIVPSASPIRTEVPIASRFDGVNTSRGTTTIAVEPSRNRPIFVAANELAIVRRDLFASIRRRGRVEHGLDRCNDQRADHHEDDRTGGGFEMHDEAFVAQNNRSTPASVRALTENNSPGTATERTSVPSNGTCTRW